MFQVILIREYLVPYVLQLQRTQFDKRARKCVFMGYQRGTKGYLL